MIFRNLIVAAAVVSTASAKSAYVTDMSHEKFVVWPEASLYAGEPIDLQFYTAANADLNLRFIHQVKAVVIRLLGTGIKFTPHQVAIRGEESPPQCRNEDGSNMDDLRVGCLSHCQNSGRYCDMDSSRPGATQITRTHGLQGHELVKESARRACVWRHNGIQTDLIKGMFSYFQYYDSVHGLGCHDYLRDSCMEQALDASGLDKEVIKECLGDMSPEADRESSIWEEELDFEQKPENIPSIFINDKEMQEFDDMVEAGIDADKYYEGPRSLLEMVCMAMPSDPKYPRPHICDFCLDWCPEKAGVNFDMNTCLWELKCGDTGKTAGTYGGFLEEYGDTHDDMRTRAPAALIQNGASFHTVGEDDSAAKGMSIIASFLGILLAGAFCALTITAVRVWRTKMIIDRYVREQQAMNNSGDFGVNGHRDPTFFPEDNELDLDLEPALQYSDHIGGANPPQQANFLPQLT